MISPGCFTYQEMDSEQIEWILFDWFRNPTHSKIDVRFCLITKPNRTIGVQLLGSIDFWFDFVRLDAPGTQYSVRSRDEVHPPLPP